MEKERPVCDVEYCTTEEAWQQLRMRIKWTDPPTPGEASVCMMNPLNIKLCLECEKPIPLRNFSAFAWTHIYQADNPSGIYREIQLNYVEGSRKWDETGLTTYEFSTVVYPTSSDEFRLTYNVKYICPDKKKVMVWANEFQEDCKLYVSPPEPENEWTKDISFSQITQNIYMGNALSILSSEELGFDAVLNFDPETEIQADEVLSPNITRAFQAMEVSTGAAHELPTDKIQDLVKWLWNVYPKYQKILIADQDGIGHAGSAMTAYVFANNPNLTFEEAYKYVSARRFIYCHKGLKDSLMESYPRD